MHVMSLGIWAQDNKCIPTKTIFLKAAAYEKVNLNNFKILLFTGGNILKIYAEHF